MNGSLAASFAVVLALGCGTTPSTPTETTPSTGSANSSTTDADDARDDAEPAASDTAEATEAPRGDCDRPAGREAFEVAMQEALAFLRAVPAERQGHEAARQQRATAVAEFLAWEGMHAQPATCAARAAAYRQVLSLQRCLAHHEDARAEPILEHAARVIAALERECPDVSVEPPTGPACVAPDTTIEARVGIAVGQADPIEVEYATTPTTDENLAERMGYALVQRSREVACLEPGDAPFASARASLLGQYLMWRERTYALPCPDPDAHLMPELAGLLHAATLLACLDQLGHPSAGRWREVWSRHADEYAARCEGGAEELAEEVPALEAHDPCAMQEDGIEQHVQEPP